MEEPAEQATTRAKLEQQILSPAQLNSLMKSTHVASTLQRAVDVGSNNSPKPTTMSDFVELRNCLVTVLLTGNLRRSLEFQEFTLQEYKNRQTKNIASGLKTVIRIARHKTGAKGKQGLYYNNNNRQQVMV